MSGMNEKLEILKSKNVLYVEDDTVTREAFVDMASRYFKKIYIASDGKEGLEKFEDLAPDFIITDVEMPVMGGIEMIKKIREIDKKIPIMTISAFDDKSHTSDEATKILIKPVRRDNLYEALSVIADMLKD